MWRSSFGTLGVGRWSESAANMQRINDERERRTRRLTIRSKHVQIGKVDRHPCWK
jgi:hypothetical protein